MNTMPKQTIIISAINFRDGGPLSVLQDCLRYVNNHLSSEYRIIALVHKIELFQNLEHIELIEFPKSAASYLYRLFYEYIYFKKISEKYDPFLWLSLHDMTPNVKASIRAVYCHNPAPFYNITFKDFWLDPRFALFNFLYKYLYQINIQKNHFVIVQQEWIRKKFELMYRVKQTIVAHPSIEITHTNQTITENTQIQKNYLFFFPTIPRVFKNIELICEAIKILNDKKISRFEVTLTIDGTENRYAKWLIKNYQNVQNLNFIGRQTREKVFELYQTTDCLIFPSKLETWGMPITEFQSFNKPILVADLEYAHETVKNYQKISFFDPYDPSDLAKYMQKAILQQLVFDSNKPIMISSPYAQNWDELFAILLDNKEKK